MKRDGCKNKYTNPRKDEKTKDKKTKRLQVSKNIQEKTKTANSNLAECEQCELTFKTTGIKRHKTVMHKTTTTPLTRQ
jgi:hypothetical protein